ncbi:hypothetical protein OH76DRAFT_1402974 [Lentinus brumalis]|uniref:Uncharacterized protein n=1 Tax=Lentinus brumalis TaxID=2498619 RepID=A0A371DC31_9APHY|nr:hypothetical protein OH76DRAFT_1402974 [Polyporus brumalis]
MARLRRSATGDLWHRLLIYAAAKSTDAHAIDCDQRRDTRPWVPNHGVLVTLVFARHCKAGNILRSPKEWPISYSGAPPLIENPCGHDGDGDSEPPSPSARDSLSYSPASDAAPGYSSRNLQLSD